MAFRRAVSAHLAAAIEWSEPGPFDWRSVLVAAVAIAAPVVVGAATGHADAGLTIGLGAMLLAGEAPSNPTGSVDRPSPGSAALPAMLAAALASLIAASRWADLLMIAVAGAAAAVSGYSRPFGVAAVRLIVYLVLSVTLLESAGPHRGAAALIFASGALWNVLIRMLLVRRTPAPPPPARRPTAAQLRANLARSLRGLAGWQYALRLVAGLGIASGLRQLFPTHHYAWIVLTAALLTQRQLEHVPVRITQRSVGTLLGVVLAWLMQLAPPSAWGTAIAICGLGTAAALARPRNYLLYAVLSTPVILLVMDIGKSAGPPLLLDRLMATLIGAAIVIFLSLAMDRLTALRPKPAGP